MAREIGWTDGSSRSDSFEVQWSPDRQEDFRSLESSLSNSAKHGPCVSARVRDYSDALCLRLNFSASKGTWAALSYDEGTSFGGAHQDTDDGGLGLLSRYCKRRLSKRNCSGHSSSSVFSPLSSLPDNGNSILESVNAAAKSDFLTPLPPVDCQSSRSCPNSPSLRHSSRRVGERQGEVAHLLVQRSAECLVSVTLRLSSVTQ